MEDSTQLCGEFALAPQEQQPTGSGAVIRSRYRGLSWDKKHQGWRVRIYFSGKQRHVGRFEDDITAAKAYDKAAVYLYGSNAITNFGLEACQVDPTEVSTFIVLAKEQAEQEQLARQHHRQQYPHPSGMPACGYSSYALQQPAYMAQQQQQQVMNMSMGMQPQHAMNMGFVMPAGMDSSSMGMHAWPQAAGAMHMGMQSASAVGNMAAVLPMMGTAVMPYQAHMQQQQQGQQQVWCPAGSMQPMMQQLNPAHAQGMQDAHMLAAHPAAAAAAGGSMQPMVTASPIASSTPMLVHSPLQQRQHQAAGVVQQYVLQGGVPVSMPAQQQTAVLAAPGYSGTALNPMQVCAVSTAAVPTSLAPAGLQQDRVLQHVHSMPAHVSHVPLQGGKEASSPGACGHVGGPTFVQDMLSSLNYTTGAAAGQAGMAACAGLQVQHHQQQQGMQGMQGMMHHSAPWGLPAHVAATSSGSVGQAMSQSWSEVPAASLGGVQQQSFA